MWWLVCWLFNYNGAKSGSAIQARQLHATAVRDLIVKLYLSEQAVQVSVGTHVYLTHVPMHKKMCKHMHT